MVLRKKRGGVEGGLILDYLSKIQKVIIENIGKDFCACFLLLREPELIGKIIGSLAYDEKCGKQSEGAGNVFTKVPPTADKEASFERQHGGGPCVHYWQILSSFLIPYENVVDV